MFKNRGLNYTNIRQDFNHMDGIKQLNLTVRENSKNEGVCKKKKTSSTIVGCL